MKDILRNPILYYILVPLAIASWPLLLWANYLPGVDQDHNVLKVEHLKASDIIYKILVLDKERLDYSKAEGKGAEFDYAVAIDRVARVVGIPSTGYRVSSKDVYTSGGQPSQSARVTLYSTDIKKFAEFLSNLQFRWASLQCEDVVLTKIEGQKNKWKVELAFKYFL
jgi:hypothetical protein